MIRFGGEKFSFLNILSIPLGYFGGRKLKKRILYFFVPFLHRVFDFEDEDDFNVLFFGDTSSSKFHFLPKQASKKNT